MGVACGFVGIFLGSRVKTWEFVWDSWELACGIRGNACGIRGSSRVDSWECVWDSWEAFV